MTPINYHYFVRGQWAGPADEKPAVIGAKFLQTLDSLSGIDPLFFRLADQQKLEDHRRRTAAAGPARHRAQTHCGDCRKGCRPQ